MKNPPILISVIGFFAALAGFAWFFWGLRILGFDWFGVLGDCRRSSSPDSGAGSPSPAGRLAPGRVRPLGDAAVGRLFVQIIAGFALFEAILAMIQFPGPASGSRMSLMPLLILWYLSTADVKAAFAENAQA